MSNQIKSLRDAANTPAGQYVSGGFQAVVVSAKSVQTKTGKTMHKAKVQEGDLTADAVSFTTDFAPYTGKLMKWVGMGIQRKDDYNGVPQFTIGDKARWIPAGDAPTTAQTHQSTAQGSQPAAPQATSAIAGVTVGMAINKAVDILVKTGDTNPDAIWKVASDIIRVSERLQRGELAPEEQAPF